MEFRKKYKLFDWIKLKGLKLDRPTSHLILLKWRVILLTKNVWKERKKCQKVIENIVREGGENESGVWKRFWAKSWKDVRQALKDPELKKEKVPRRNS